jgi:hypothetical protein
MSPPRSQRPSTIIMTGGDQKGSFNTVKTDRSVSQNEIEKIAKEQFKIQFAEIMKQYNLD